MALWSRRAVPAPIVLPVAPIQTFNEHPFRGWTESLFVSGLIRDEDRLSDALNRASRSASTVRRSCPSGRRPRAA